MRSHILFFALWLVATGVCDAQKVPASFKNAVTDYMQLYQFGFNGKAEPVRIEDIRADVSKHELHVYVGEQLGWNTFSPGKVRKIYDDVRRFMPKQNQDYKLFIYSKGQLLEELVLGGAEKSELQRTWGDLRHRGAAWVTPLDRVYETRAGLKGRHLSICASHGRYYEQKETTWRWQRPHLFCTTEDLLSQTFVIPYLMPMLENAGAVVFSPRERDWQRHEVIVDNDGCRRGGRYTETAGSHAWQKTDSAGFAQTKDVYVDGENPFRHGTARRAATQTGSKRHSTITWQPAIPEAGPYAVYVSYQTLPTSVTDATYVVHHRGQATRFRVNQQMGSGTWVYLGTFDFAAGESAQNCVTLSNRSSERGHVTADAVRFGGGMGNIARGDSTHLAVSGLPRFLEGARYSAQWAGMPYEDYANKNGLNDYAEDINIRSNMTNRLARGSAYFPSDTAGLGVPIELSMALHTDAGYTQDSSLIGSLSIYTTDFQEGLLPTGISRLISRDLANMVLTQVDEDMRALYGHWTRRQMYDRNYSETREPRVPSLILEMLSHQNFADMRLAHDPTFKFHMARAAYKAVLRFIHRTHGIRNTIVQPLPVTAPAAYVIPGSHQIRVSWTPVEDPLETSARPTAYVVYHAQNNGGFDNGTLTQQPHFALDNARPGVLHRFIITAANDGGQSLPSQEVCAYISTLSPQRMFIIDAFDRLAGPQPVETDSTRGFNMDADPGVPIARMPGYSGRQQNFQKPVEGRRVSGMGFSGAELEGTIIAGNTLDWSTRHARDIITASGGRITISSLTQDAVSRPDFDSRNANLIDLIFGLERRDGYSLRPAKVMNEAMTQMVAAFVRTGGNVVVSGAYIGSDMHSKADRLLTRTLFNYEYAGTLCADSIRSLSGMNLKPDLRRGFCQQEYGTPYADCLAPVSPAFCTMVYGPSKESAAVAYQGTNHRTMAFGFPIETIKDAATRVQLWKGILSFLLP